jgi:CelD/BcsL family acetyltransferase involved in cellulose biosynthesis
VLSVERISNRSEFASLRDEWEKVLAASGSDSIHRSHGWLAAWADTYGRDRELCVLRLRDGSETIGFAPLMFNTVRMKRFLPYRQMLWMGDPWIDFGDFIMSRNRDEAVRATMQHLAEKEDWGELLLHVIPEPSPNLPMLREAVGRHDGAAEWKVDSPCYHIPMKDRTWEEFWPTTNKNFVRKDIVRLGNHYNDHTWSVTAFGAESVLERLPVLGTLHESSQERKGRSSFYGDAMFRQFIDRLRSDEVTSNWIRGYLLEIDGRPAAYVLGFEYKRIFYYWNIGFEVEFAKLSPSKFLLYNILRAGFEEKRWDEFNFMRGATDYKRRWASDSYDLYQLRLLNTRGVYGAMNRLRRVAGAEV